MVFPWNGMRSIVAGLGALLLVSGCAAPVTVETLQQWHARDLRAETVAQRLLIANLQACPKHGAYYGFTSISFKPGVSAQVRQVWSEAFHVQDGSTVITVVPHGPAARAGLRVGDAIVAVDGVRWSTPIPGQTPFDRALLKAMSAPAIDLVVHRPEGEVALRLTGEEACKGTIALADTDDAEGYASDTQIVLDSGLVTLLRDDDELAFVIAHELAHIILGHTTAERAKDREDPKIRSAMERAADALAIRLMVRAGYDPAGATTAVKKLDYANRGPIARLLGLHGAYMPTAQRVAFLQGCAAKLGPSVSQAGSRQRRDEGGLP